MLETIDPLKPAVLRGTDTPDFLYLLMPVRIVLSPAGPAVSRCVVALAHRLPLLRRAELELGPGHGDRGRERRRARPRCSRPSPGLALGRSFRGVPDAALVRHGCERGDRARRGGSTTSAGSSSRPSSGSQGRNRVP